MLIVSNLLNQTQLRNYHNLKWTWYLWEHKNLTLSLYREILPISIQASLKIAKNNNLKQKILPHKWRSKCHYNSNMAQLHLLLKPHRLLNRVEIMRKKEYKKILNRNRWYWVVVRHHRIINKDRQLVYRIMPISVMSKHHIQLLDKVLLIIIIENGLTIRYSFMKEFKRV